MYLSVAQWERIQSSDARNSPILNFLNACELKALRSDVLKVPQTVMNWDEEYAGH